MENKLTLLLHSTYTSLDETSQESIYSAFYQFVHPKILLITKDHAITEDIIQDAFLKTIFKMPKVANEKQLKAWIKKTTKNQTLDTLKKLKKDRNQDNLERVYFYDKANSVETYVEKAAEINMLRENIATYLREMNPDYRQIIELKWEQQMGNKDIAKQLGLTEGAVKLKLHRARKLLKKKIAKDWGV